MIDLRKKEIWFVTGSQHLYGDETLQQVAEHSKTISASLNDTPQIPVTVIYKPTVKTAEEITLFVWKPMLQRIVLASLPGCIPSPQQKCG